MKFIVSCMKLFVSFLVGVFLSAFVGEGIIGVDKLSEQTSMTLTGVFTLFAFFCFDTLPRILKRQNEQRKWERQQRENDRRREQDRINAEAEDDRRFEKNLERERRQLEMRRQVDLKYSIEERIRNMEITEHNRRRVREMEREMEGASVRKLEKLYKELDKFEGR